MAVWKEPEDRPVVTRRTGIAPERRSSQRAERGLGRRPKDRVPCRNPPPARGVFERELRGAPTPIVVWNVESNGFESTAIEPIVMPDASIVPGDNDDRAVSGERDGANSRAGKAVRLRVGDETALNEPHDTGGLAPQPQVPPLVLAERRQCRARHAAGLIKGLHRRMRPVDIATLAHRLEPEAQLLARASRDTTGGRHDFPRHKSRRTQWRLMIE